LLLSFLLLIMAKQNVHNWFWYKLCIYFFLLAFQLSINTMLFTEAQRLKPDVLWKADNPLFSFSSIPSITINTRLWSLCPSSSSDQISKSTMADALVSTILEQIITTARLQVLKRLVMPSCMPKAFLFKNYCFQNYTCYLLSKILNYISAIRKKKFTNFICVFSFLSKIRKMIKIIRVVCFACIVKYRRDKNIISWINNEKNIK